MRRRFIFRAMNPFLFFLWCCAAQLAPWPTADGAFESGRVTRTGTGECAVTRYEYHRGTVVVRDSVLILYATMGRIRSVAPCDLNSDYEKNDTGVETLRYMHPGAPSTES